MIGEKIELGKFEFVIAECVTVYNHPGNRVATIVGFNKTADEQVMRDVAMQAAAMAPVALDKDQVDASVLEREIEIGKEQARAEGKPEEMLEKIAMGKLNKFYKENTLLNQDFIKDNKKTVAQYMNDSEKGLTATGFKRVALG
jgi:elongation factor Ts